MATSAPLSSPRSPDGRLIVVSGPSGVGKSTVLRALADRVAFGFSVSATTRAARPGEVHGVDYLFVSKDRFLEMIDRQELVEWAEYGGNLYGTPVASVDRARRESRLVILDIELEGARQVRGLFPEATLIWIAPPSFEHLERRLRSRGDTDEAAIRRRLDRARRDMVLAPALFDHVVINDAVDDAVAELVEILGAID